MRREFRTQLDLFVRPGRPPELRPGERQNAVALLQGLLREATTKISPGLSSENGKEVGDEQDRA
jgi:hypothetical protein